MPAPANAPDEFDLFISYAHSDDIRGIVPALHDQLELTDDEKLDDTLAARRVLDTLRPRGAALFLLDNVDTPALLAPDQLALLSGESGIRLLLTTRLAPGAFTAAGAAVTAIDLDQLPEDHALDTELREQRGVRTKQKIAAWDQRYLLKLLSI